MEYVESCIADLIYQLIVKTSDLTSSGGRWKLKFNHFWGEVTSKLCHCLFGSWSIFSDKWHSLTRSMVDQWSV